MKRKFLFSIALIAISLFISISDVTAQTWNLNGNAATTATNFLGTTDAKDLIIKTNGITRMQFSGNTTGLVSVNNSLYVNPSGGVGIGTSTPATNLEVRGINTDARVTSASSASTGNAMVLGMCLSNSNGAWNLPNNSSQIYSQNNLKFYINAGGIWNSTRADLIFSSGFSNNVEYMIIQGSNGSVGIGTTCIPADGKLAVNGKIYATALQLKLTNSSGCFPDYVFDASYKLMPLKEVDAYIQKNKHLPGVPTATEVEANGVNVMDLNVKMLEKIEELTLYMIQLQKENQLMKEQINTLLK